MKSIILLIIMSISTSISAQTQGWFIDHVMNDLSRNHHTRASIPHKDRTPNEPIKLIQLKESWEKTEENDFHYLSDDERKLYKLTFSEGRVWDANGNEFDTRDGYAGQAMFVMSEDGSVYAAKKPIPNVFAHHSLVAGKPVICAGSLEVHAGKVERISDFSAQYPSKSYYALTKAVALMKKQGISFHNKYVLYNRDVQ